jgi:erythromycin esterase-like protein
MSERGELNLGQLVREHFLKKSCVDRVHHVRRDGHGCFGLGRTGRAQNCAPRASRKLRRLFHDVDVPNFFLNLRKDVDVAAQLRSGRLERAIGVIYRPDTELISHYFHARLPDQFDAILHYGHTRAVEPLERTAEWEMGEVEETFPSGL